MLQLPKTLIQKKEEQKESLDLLNKNFELSKYTRKTIVKPFFKPSCKNNNIRGEHEKEDDDSLLDDDEREMNQQQTLNKKKQRIIQNYNNLARPPTKIIIASSSNNNESLPPPRIIILKEPFITTDHNVGAERLVVSTHEQLQHHHIKYFCGEYDNLPPNNEFQYHSKLKQTQNDEMTESERYPPFLLQSTVENMDITHYIDLLSKFVEDRNIYFTSDAEACEYFRKKCERRQHWEYGFEWIRILSVLRGRNIPKMVRNKEAALLEFLIHRDERTGNEILNLTHAEDYRKFAEFLRGKHPDDFERLRNFLISNPSLIAYMRTIITSSNGYFPHKEATQNLALWIYGITQSGKTTLASIITFFLVTCKMRAANEKFMNPNGDNYIPNKALFYNIFQLEELKKSGKGPDDLMDLIDGGVSVIKGKDSSGWGSDLKGNAYHFPILITSNYSPKQLFCSSKKKNNLGEDDDKFFHDAALRRIICIEVNNNERMPPSSSLPNLSHNNRFRVSRVTLAQFVWAFVYHSEIEIELGGNLCSSNAIRSYYEEPENVELTLQELSLPKGTKVSLNGGGGGGIEHHHQQQNNNIDSVTTTRQQQQNNNRGQRRSRSFAYEDELFDDDVVIPPPPLTMQRDPSSYEVGKEEGIPTTKIMTITATTNEEEGIICDSQNLLSEEISILSNNSNRRTTTINNNNTRTVLAWVQEFMYGISLSLKLRKEGRGEDEEDPIFFSSTLYARFLEWIAQYKIPDYCSMNTIKQNSFGAAIKKLHPQIVKLRYGHNSTRAYKIDRDHWLSQTPISPASWSLIEFDCLSLHSST